MKDRRFVFVLPNDDDGAPVEVRGNNKFLRLSTSLAVSTAQREIRGDPLHRTGGLPPSLMGSFFWAGVGGDDDTENDDLLLPPCYPMLPLENYGQYANLLPKPAAPSSTSTRPSPSIHHKGAAGDRLHLPPRLPQRAAPIRAPPRRLQHAGDLLHRLQPGDGAVGGGAELRPDRQPPSPRA
jgi:hypothetical protein